MDKTQQPATPSRGAATDYMAYDQRHFAPAETEFNKWLFSLWDGRYLILTSLIAFLLFGVFYVWRATPLFQAEALIQIQTKRPAVSGDNISKMDGLLPEPTQAAAEMEILTSSQLLHQVAVTLELDLDAGPKTLPVIGKALLRSKSSPPKIEVGSFQIPEALRGEALLLTSLQGGEFRLEYPPEKVQVKGQVGQAVTIPTSAGQAVLTVRSLSGEPGQKFKIARLPWSSVEEGLRSRLEVAEKGRQSNVMGLAYTDPSPARSAAVLDEIMREYVIHYQEERRRQTAQILAQLEHKMPSLQENVQASEGRLSGTKSRTATVDVNREADLLLQQIAGLKSQITLLRQRKDELLRTYTEQADSVLIINRQILQLQAEEARAEGRMRTLPSAQREEQKVSRDVLINTNLYASLLNDIRQLQIYSAGDPGNIAIVDKAHTNPLAVYPKTKLFMTIFFLFGCFVGIGLALLKSIFRRGIEDFRIIESQLGIPVLETIPHSDAQEAQNHAAKKHHKVKQILAVDNTEDPAMEGLRGLRTMLHISMREKSSRVVMITGPSPAVGKTFISTNLAVLLAQGGARVLLVDADLRRGCQHAAFGLHERGIGLSDILAGRWDWQTAINPVRSAPGEDATKFYSFNLITTGVLPRNPSELLLTDRLAQFLAEAADSYDYIILDAPPLLAVTDTTLIAEAADEVLLVARYGHHPLEELRACQVRLEKHGIPLTGCVFNDIEAAGFNYLFHPYRYAYQYNYKSEA